MSSCPSPTTSEDADGSFLLRHRLRPSAAPIATSKSSNSTATSPTNSRTKSVALRAARAGATRRSRNHRGSLAGGRHASACGATHAGLSPGGRGGRGRDRRGRPPGLGGEARRDARRYTPPSTTFASAASRHHRTFRQRSIPSTPAATPPATRRANCVTDAGAKDVDEVCRWIDWDPRAAAL